MEIRTWIASITEDGLNEVARKSRIAQRTLYNQLDKGHLTAENVIRIATTYNAHPFRALIDTGHIDPAWALVPDIRAALRLASEDDLGDEVLYRMKLGTSTLGDKTVDQLVEERADNVRHLPTPAPNSRKTSSKTGMITRWPTAAPTTTRRTLTSMTDKLHALADSLGVEVVWHRHGPKGLWSPGPRMITLREGMGWRKERSTLAHELGHAIHNDLPTTDRRLHARQEDRADAFAVRLLITPDEYAAAEAIHGSHIGALAVELGITTHLIGAARRLHERITTS